MTVQEILDGVKMNLPMMEEVTKKAQKAKTDNQTTLFEVLNALSASKPV